MRQHRRMRTRDSGRLVAAGRTGAAAPAFDRPRAGPWRRQRCRDTGRADDALPFSGAAGRGRPAESEDADRPRRTGWWSRRIAGG